MQENPKDCTKIFHNLLEELAIQIPSDTIVTKKIDALTKSLMYSIENGEYPKIEGYSKRETIALLKLFADGITHNLCKKIYEIVTGSTK